MGIEQWWSALDAGTRQWLVDHAGEAIPADLVAEIRQAGDPSAIEVDLVEDEEGSGVVLSDSAIDWVDTVANEETPEQA